MQPENRMREKIRAVLAIPHVGDLAAAYYDPDGPFAGTSFDLLGENPPGALTNDDLLATTLLDISWRPRAVRQILAGRGVIAEVLAAIPVDLDLWFASADVVRAATRLYEWLDARPGVGPAIASKFLARKRPRLVPIGDNVIYRVLDPPEGKFWSTLAAALSDPLLREQIEMLRPAGMDSVTLLRLLDVAIWMSHSKSGNARGARKASGTPEPAVLPAGAGR